MNGLRELGRSTASAVLERVGRGMSKVQERKPLPHDVLESDDAYLVVFDAPGATREDVQVRFVDNEVQVRIDRFRDFYEGFEMRFPGRGLSLDGAAELPDDASVEAGEPNATLTKNGVLRVRIPKDDRGRTVAVEEEEEAGEEGEADVSDISEASEASEGDESGEE
ncbi:Hsp20/alpha crystallin family protein [Halegenticoccus soli]|uniref:Hsp20/alpha crystallin family protein n=1 Tax=Halegenticoccus soli TaxID=1985678 RepID=UPI000C6E0C74|nr:Hsp20/alpha crystallin family protein [Halegenticoccus soli]